MLTGWAAQMRSRALSVSTVEPRVSSVRRFMSFVGEYPWRWTAEDVDAWSTELLGQRLARSTLRGYQASLRQFCDYLVDARYSWTERCLELFGTHPVQVCHEWNTARHTVEVEARPAVRPLTRGEVQRLFDHADGQVAAARRLGRKGWSAAWRDAAVFKLVYEFGLRRREVAMLDTVDFHRNAAAPEFGSFGVCQVRYGKAMRGSPPRRRSVAAVWSWTTTVLEEYLERVRPSYAVARGPALWPTERGGRVSGGLPDAAVRGVPGRGRAAGGAAPALPAPLLRDPSGGGRLGPDIRAAAGRPHMGVDDRALHRGVGRLQEPAAAGHPGPAHRGPVVIGREVGYTWRLRQVMAAHGLFSTTDLQPLLAERGVELSAAQVYRLVTQPPERLNMRVLAAVCDALQCTPSGLIEPAAADTTTRAPRRRRGEPAPAAEAAPPDRPTRMQLLPPT